MGIGQPINLNYAIRPPQGGVRPAYLVSRLISSYIGYMLVMGVLVLIVPRFETVFRDFKLSLPAMTMALLGVSRWTVQLYLWAVCIPLPALWAWANASIVEPTLRRRLRQGAVFLVLAFLVLTVITLLMPMLALIEGVSTPSAKP